MSFPYFLVNVNHYSHLSPSYQAFLSKFSTTTEPHNYSEAIQDNKWIHVMNLEIGTLVDNKTWEVVYLLVSKVPIGS